MKVESRTKGLRLKRLLNSASHVIDLPTKAKSSVPGGSMGNTPTSREIHLRFEANKVSLLPVMPGKIDTTELRISQMALAKFCLLCRGYINGAGDAAY